MEPLTTLADCFGPGVAFNPRVPLGGKHFVTGARAETADYFTGTFLTIAGETPLVCHARALRPEGLALLEEAGFPVAPNRVVYEDAAGYRAALESVVPSGRRLAFQHVHPLDQARPELYAIPRELLAFLNNKANLGELVPPEHAPRRRLLPIAEARGLEPGPARPVVLKGITDLSTGASGVVAIARSREDVAAACDRLAFSEVLIAEDFLPFSTTFCLNYAADQAGIRYLGSAEQITLDDGEYIGNWFDSEHQGPAPGIAAGMEVMRRAWALGYRGIAGFDVGALPDGRVVVFDLNFRLCGSTVGLLWQEALRTARGAFQGRIAMFKGTQGFSTMCRTARTALQAGWLVPFGAFDSEVGADPSVTPLLRGLVLGSDRDEVEERRRYLAEQGLTS